MEQPADLGRRLSQGEGEVRRWGGTIVTIKQSARETEGRYTLLEILDSPGTLVPLHIHHREDETFYLYEGSMRIRSAATCSMPAWDPSSRFRKAFPTAGL